LVESALLSPVFNEVTDRVAEKAMSSPSPNTAFVERWNPMVKEPAEALPWFLTVFDTVKFSPGAMAVTVLDRAERTKSALGDDEGGFTAVDPPPPPLFPPQAEKAIREKKRIPRTACFSMYLFMKAIQCID
jgi:hypothetical protein